MGITDKQFQTILYHEGRYANLKGDSGGETYCGVARNYHPDWEGWAVLDWHKEQGHDLDSDRVFEALGWMVRRFYDDYSASLHILLEGNVFNQILDSGVTGGAGAAVHVQQKTCELLGVDPKGVDGLIGPGARAAIDELNQSLNEDGELAGDVLPFVVFAAQMDRYLKVIDGKCRGATDEEKANYLGHFRSWVRRSLAGLPAG